MCTNALPNLGQDTGTGMLGRDPVDHTSPPALSDANGSPIELVGSIELHSVSVVIV